MPTAEQFQSKMVSGSGNNQTGKIVVSVTKGQQPAEPYTIPELSSTWPGPEELYFNYFTLDPGMQYDTYTYHYSKITDGYLRSVVKGGLTNLPLKDREGYRTAWEYVLVTDDPAKVGVLPAWYSTKTDTTLDDYDYDWAQNPGNLKQDFKVVTGGDELWKRGAKTYRYFSVIVTETTYFEKEEDADALCEVLGFLRAPNKTHNRETADKHWLVVSANTSYEGSYYMTQVNYEYKNVDNEGWDEDMYDIYVGE